MNDFHAVLSGIKLVASDCDGVLTDGGLYYSENGDVMRRFCVLDGVGFIRLSEMGIATAIITAEENSIVKKRAEKLKVNYLIMGTTDKLTALRELCTQLSISLEQAAYIGDDMFDIPAIRDCGFGCAPPNAMQPVKKVADYCTSSCGGAGCFREVADMIISARQQNP